MRLNIILIVIFGIILSGCQPTVVPQGPWVRKIHSEEFSKLMLNLAAKLKSEQRLDLEDSWIAYDDAVKKWCVRFSSQRLLTLCEARLLIVLVVEELLERLNHHCLISFELERYPFTASDVDVQISFESFFGHFVDPLYTGMVWLQAGCVHFYAFNRKVLDYDWNHDRFEPYFKSRELAYLKQEADLPFVDERERSDEEDFSSVLEEQRFAPNLVR